MKLNSHKLNARIIRQEAGAQNGPPGAGHRVGRVKAQKSGKAKAHEAPTNDDQDTRNNINGRAHRDNQVTQVVGSGGHTFINILLVKDFSEISVK